MPLVQEDIDLVQHLIKQAMADVPEVRNVNVRYELDLRERTIRVEEELKHQRELMLEGFKQMDKRFEQVDKRFEQIQIDMDKRFEQMRVEMNQRFEGMVRRLDRFMFWSLGLTVSSAIFVVTYLK
ncbi:MAG: hypothetical protein CVV13_06440 [Gammaproteobacteria bacterium HGW-Gammaproteobacteria-3]|nr:MAG: hypothetical protein CVV13_06440 [Gammaproteobacteria bacterium HGW-Gammaproteobacteria-3]